MRDRKCRWLFACFAFLLMGSALAKPPKPSSRPASGLAEHTVEAKAAGVLVTIKFPNDCPPYTTLIPWGIPSPRSGHSNPSIPPRLGDINGKQPTNVRIQRVQDGTSPGRPTERTTTDVVVVARGSLQDMFAVRVVSDSATCRHRVYIDNGRERSSK